MTSTHDTPPDQTIRLLPNAPYSFTWNGRDYFTGLYVTGQGMMTVVDGQPVLVPLDDIWQATLQACVFARDILELVDDTVPDPDDDERASTPLSRMAYVVHRLIEAPAEDRPNLINPIGPRLRFRDLDPDDDPAASLRDFVHMVGGPLDGALTTIRRPALEAGASDA